MDSEASYSSGSLRLKVRAVLMGDVALRCRRARDVGSRWVGLEQLESRILLSGTEPLGAPLAPDWLDDIYGAAAADAGVGPGIHLDDLNLHLSGATDTYYFELLRADDLEIAIDFAQADGNLDLSITDEGGAELGRGDSVTDDEIVSIAGLLPGMYYIHVFSPSSDTNTYDLSVEPGAASDTAVYYVNDTETASDYYTLAEGDDANDGLSPLTPKLTVGSVLSDYTLGPNDLVLVDTGDYLEAVTLTVDDEGSAYAGSPSGSSLIDAGTRFDLIDSDFNLIYGFVFGGAATGTGIHARGDGADESVSNIFRGNTFSGTSTGVQLDGGEANVLVGNTISGSGDFGVRMLLGASGEIRGNDISERTDGIFLEGGSTALIEYNVISQADQGVFLDWDTDATVAGNEIYASNYGIRSVSDVTEAYGNEIHHNTTGIYGRGMFGGSDWSIGQPNDVHNNATGISANGGATVQFNFVHRNDIGVHVEGEGQVDHNVIYRNTTQSVLITGIFFNNPNGAAVTGNTIYAPLGNGVRVEDSSENTSLKNNIIWAESGYDISVATDSQVGFVSEYNNLFVSGGGRIAWWQKDFTDLFDWQVETGYDTHSIGYTSLEPTLDNPQFANLGGDDYRLTDQTSTSIDAGDPSYLHVNEPGPNGSRVNLGAYGNTAEAALSSSAYVDISYPNYYADLQAVDGQTIFWRTFDDAEPSKVLSGALDIDLYEEGFGKVADIAVVPAADGSVGWTPADLGLSGDAAKRYRIRLTSLAGQGVMGESREAFSIVAADSSYYVDDGSNADDEYTPAAVGSNRNTGQTPLDPKASLSAVLHAYDLGPGDEVQIDTGQYAIVRNLVVTGDLAFGNDEGVEITGPTDPNRIALLDRANREDGSACIEVRDGDYVTLSHLTIVGARTGVWVHNSSDHFTGSHLVVTDNTSNDYFNLGAGIRIESDVARLTASDVYNNDAGIIVETDASAPLTVIGSADPAGNPDVSLGLGNRIHDNESYGVFVRGNVLVAGNTVYGNAGWPEAGIDARYGADIIDNVVFGNITGIINQVGGVVSGNRVYANSGTGISVDFDDVDVVGNVVYSNEIGIGTHSYYNGVVANNLVYANTDVGIRLDASIQFLGESSDVLNNTVYQQEGNAIELGGVPKVELRNNILWVESGYGIQLGSAAVTIPSDYNLIYATGTGMTGYAQSQPLATLANWRNVVQADANSFSHDPLFVDPDGPDGILGYASDGSGDGRDDDFHLQSPYGSFHGGVLAPVLDLVTGLPVMLTPTETVDLDRSPGIDRGFEGDSFANEPSPNGGYVNVGAYGNTVQASRSPAQQVLVVRPDGGEIWHADQSYTIRWRSHDYSGTVDVELIQEGVTGAVLLISDDTPNDGELLWSIPADLAPGTEYRVRITRNDAGGLSDFSDDVFTITSPVTNFICYVNDNSVNASGDWTTAPGNDANDGLSPSAPKASIKSALQAYDFEPGDMILVDDGTYPTSVATPIGANDAGVEIRGYYDALFPARQALLQGPSNYRAFEVTNTSGITLDRFVIADCYAGFYVENVDGVVITNSDISGYRDNAIHVSISDDVFIANNHVHHTSTGGYGWDDKDGIVVSGYNSNASITVIGNVVHDNAGSGIIATGFSTATHKPSVLVTGNTVYSNSSTDTAGIVVKGNGAVASDNVVYDNHLGVWAEDAVVDANRVFNNVTGILATKGSEIGGNRVYSNTVGIRTELWDGYPDVPYSGHIANNVIYANSDQGIVLDGSGQGVRVINNTVYQPAGDAILAQDSEGIWLRNNILAVDGGYGIYVADDAQTGFDSDYNVIFTTGAGKVGSWQGVDFAGRLDWYYDVGQDAHSTDADPWLRDPDGADGILGYNSVAGVDGGQDDDFHLQPNSPGIDAGDPFSYYLAESSPNGLRANVGAYGNTDEASASPQQMVQVLSPNGLEKFEVYQQIDIGWRSAGLTETNTVAMINVGGDVVDNWMYDRYRTRSYSDGLISPYISLDLSGVTNPAPEDVYRSYTKAYAGAGSYIAYSMPLADGDYTVRLHFADTSTSARVFDIFMQDVLVSDNYEVSVDAGGANKATTQSFSATVSGGDGFRLKLVNEAWNSAILSGIEILSEDPSGAAAPTVDLEASTDNGATWSTIVQGVSVDRFGRGEHTWTAGPPTTGNTALIRVSANEGSAPQDTSDAPFLIAGNGADYYVNDFSIAGDVFATSPGDNANSGKSPDAPVASPLALLESYDLDPGDTIHVDTGVYSIVRNVVIGSDDSGVRIEGPQTGGAVFDRGSTDDGRYVFELRDADNVVLSHLGVTGADAGVYVGGESDSDNLLIRNNEIYGNNRGLVMGFYEYDQRSDNDGGAITGNDIHDNDVGISSYGKVLISGNTVHDNAGTEGLGIDVHNGGEVRENEIHGNFNGVKAHSSLIGGNRYATLVIGNRVYDNTDTGIISCEITEIAKNVVYSNSTGIRTGETDLYLFYGEIRNNLVYSNANYGVLIEYAEEWQKYTPTILNNTIYQPVGDAVRVTDSSNVVLRNNILYVDAGYAIQVDANGTVGFDSDYNLLQVTGTGKIGSWAGSEFVGRTEWYYEAGQDPHSRQDDPLFVDPAGPDGILGYDTLVSVDGGADDDFHLQPASPGIDSGDPRSFYLSEPAPHGNRVNVGAYGNTTEAAASPAQMIQVLSPNGLEKLVVGQPVPVEWHSSGLSESGILMQMNCGGPRVYDWLADNYGGLDNDDRWFTDAVDTSGLSDPAPEAVYQTYSNAPYGDIDSASYLFPVPDGQYTIRLHFAEFSSTANVFDIALQGITVFDDYNIATKAGGLYKAVAQSFGVTASGGEGILLELLKEGYSVAQVAGVEIMAVNPGGVSASTLDLELSTDSGDSWTPIATDLDMGLFGRGSYMWSPEPLTDVNTALIRVTANQGANPQDTSDQAFLITNAGADYYVNDADTVGDVFTTVEGDNDNSGKSPAAPMASLSALLTAYDLGPGDTVHVDTGTYALARDGVIEADDSGVRIEGPDSAAAVLDRGNTNDDVYAVELRNADDVTLEHLSITGAYVGVYAGVDGDSDNLAITACDIYGLELAGVYLRDGNDDAVITGNSVHDTSYVPSGSGPYPSPFGIRTDGDGATVVNNRVYDWNVGILASLQSHSEDPDDTAVVSNNIVHDNLGAGISASRNVTVTGNSAYGNSTGINVREGARAAANVVYGNDVGIDGAGAEINGNRVYGNSEIGIHQWGAGDVFGNTVYNSAVGIFAGHVSGYGPPYRDMDVFNNLVYANSEAGIRILDTSYWNADFSNVRITNNTVYQEVGSAIDVKDGSVIHLRNNILAIEVGHCIYSTADSSTKLDSDHNLFSPSDLPEAHAGFFNALDQHLLVDWQAASEQDLQSLTGDPGFVDIDGADNILGYSTAGGGFDGGRDDNFHLSGGSPAIDSAEHWTSPPTDIDGLPRANDPGMPDSTGFLYTETVLGASEFDTVGIAQNWKYGDFENWTLDFPAGFTFDFYGLTYSSVDVSMHGYLQFGAASDPDDANTLDDLINNRRIAPLWYDLSPMNYGDDIYVDISVPDEVTVRWQTSNGWQSPGWGVVNAAVTLYSTGQIAMHYGPGNTNMTPTVGISAGDGLNYIVSTYDGQASLTDGNSILYDLTPAARWSDKGAYEFRGDTNDIDPPVVIATNPVDIQTGSVVASVGPTIGVTFSEVVNNIDANALANYDLRSPGPNGTYDDGDDVVFDIVPRYTPGSAEVSLDIVAGMLPEGSYRLTVNGNTSIHDLTGNHLDGDSSGTEGGNYVRFFTVALLPPSVTASDINDSLSQRSMINSLAIAFDQDVSASLDPEDLSIENTTTGEASSLGGVPVAYDFDTDTATWDTSALLLADGNYTAVLSASGVENSSGSQMAEDYTFFFHVLRGDGDGDREVGDGDLDGFVNQFGQRGDALTTDFNNDGRVNLADFVILRRNFGNTLPAPAPDPAPAPTVAPETSVSSTSAHIPVEISVDVLAEPADTNAERTLGVPDQRVGDPVLAFRLGLSTVEDAFASKVIPEASDTVRTEPFRAATTEHDLRPLSDDLETGDADDLLTDILAESALALPL